MSLRLDKGRYWILTYWSREGGRRIQEYIGLDEGKAYGKLVEVLLDKVAYYQEHLAEAKQHLNELGKQAVRDEIYGKRDEGE